MFCDPSALPAFSTPTLTSALCNLPIHHALLLPQRTPCTPCTSPCSGNLDESHLPVHGIGRWHLQFPHLETLRILTSDLTDCELLDSRVLSRAGGESIVMPKPKPKGLDKPVPSRASQPPPPPAWPLFKQPAWQTTTLEPESMLDGKVVLIRNFWTKSLCKDYVSFLRTLSLTTTPGRPKRGEAARVNDRFQVHDQAFANRLWAETGLGDVLLGEEWKALW